MGKIPILTQEQQIILGELRNNEFLRENFYFTGGTALSQFYLQHRLSDDLDFFTTDKFDNQTTLILMNDWGKKHNFTFQSRVVEPVQIFNLTFTGKKYLKVDFSYYPYTLLEKPILYEEIKIDSLTDIAANKLLTINQRSDVKDFVDLYFLFKKFPFWDLMGKVRKKFPMELDPLLMAADMLKVEDFEFLPKMIKPLDLKTLKTYFRKRAKEIGGSIVK